MGDGGPPKRGPIRMGATQPARPLLISDVSTVSDEEQHAFVRPR